MRLLLIAFALILLGNLSALASGAGWTPYGNARFGYGINLPHGFSCDPESEDGDGRACQSADGAQFAVWGGYTNTVSDGGFAGEVKFDRDSDAGKGLSITYQKTTPHWAVYSGTRSGSIVYTRMIDGCNGAQYAAFELDYPPALDIEMKPVITGLTSSLKQQTCDESAGAN
jgi:hypothetical protein